MFISIDRKNNSINTISFLALSGRVKLCLFLELKDLKAGNNVGEILC